MDLRLDAQSQTRPIVVLIAARAATARSSRFLVVAWRVSDTHPVDAITSTRMIQLAQAMQQLPTDVQGPMEVAQLAHTRELLDSAPAATAPAPPLVTPAQHVDLYA